jgi:HD-GYP domain-containing protein (c-di-GMP phosphodiesterase class II)
MRKISAADLKLGQTFERALFIDEDSIFIPQNTAVLQKDLDLLSSLGIYELFMEDEPVNITGAEAYLTKKKVISNFPRLKLANPKISSSINNLIDQINTVFDAIKAKSQVNMRLLWSITNLLIELVRNSRDDVLKLILCEDAKAGFEMAKNAMDTAILSVIIGIELKFSNTENQELAAAALLHDAGMLRLPEYIVKKDGPLSNRELEIIQSHVLHSFNIMKRELMYPVNVCQIALQHHEHWDGNGYPRHLLGDEIDRCALIVAIADAFVAMMSKKAYRNMMTGYQAMKTLLSENDLYFSPEILKLFVRIIGIYPIGSGVLLSDNSIARIVSVNTESPLRPIVQVVIDKDGDAVEKEEKIDLFKNKKLFITCAIDIKRFQA